MLQIHTRKNSQFVDSQGGYSGIATKINPSTCAKNRPQVLLNFAREPCIEHLTFSSFTDWRMSLIQYEWEGGAGDYHLNKIKRLANKETKATKSAL